jgi:hypothetical protein
VTIYPDLCLAVIKTHPVNAAYQLRIESDPKPMELDKHESL